MIPTETDFATGAEWFGADSGWRSQNPGADREREAAECFAFQIGKKCVRNHPFLLTVRKSVLPSVHGKHDEARGAVRSGLDR